MKLVQLFDLGDDVVYVNPEGISFLQKYGDGTEINLLGGHDSILVQESVQTVVELLGQSNCYPQFLTMSTLVITGDKQNA